jgi:hypothetical protein
MVVAVRLTEAEYRYLQALGMKQGRTVGEIMRFLALAGMPQPARGSPGCLGDLSGMIGVGGG